MKLALLFIVLSLVALIILDKKSELLLAASCDGKPLTVELHRNQLFPAFFGVDIELRVLTENRDILLRRQFDNRDVWDDAARRYSRIICSKNIIKVGPGYWNAVTQEIGDYELDISFIE